MTDNELEFYEKATNLSNELRQRGNMHFYIVDDLIDIYKKNDNSFPDTLFFGSFKRRRLSTTKEILQTLNFFNDERCIDDYDFIKEKIRVPLFRHHCYIDYTLTIRPKEK